MWAFAALLVVWGNLVSYFVQPTLPGGDWAAVAWGVALFAVSGGVARAAGLRRADLGLVRGDPRFAVAAAVLGLAAAGAGAIVLRVGPILGGPVEYRPLLATTAGALAWHIAFFLPLAAVIPEELAFRGALLGGLRARHGVPVAIGGSSIAFALWHAFVVYVTLLQTNIAGSALAWLAGAAALLFVAIAGAALGLLRVRSRGLAAPALAHWAFDATLLLGLQT